MTTLVFLEHHEGALEKGGLGVLAKARALGLDAAGVVLGSDVGEAAGRAQGRVYVCDAPALSAPLPQPRVDALAALVEHANVDTVLFAASVLASDVAGDDARAKAQALGDGDVLLLENVRFEAAETAKDDAERGELADRLAALASG